MAARRELGDGRSGSELTILDLLSYRLHRVANGMSRSAALRYRREFGVNLGEWRAIALIGCDPQLTLSDLARLAGLDKAQMSRVVSKLVERGLISRQSGASRSTQLTLSPAGEDLYKRLMGAASERNEAFSACLTPEERTTLDQALNKLRAVARETELMERAIGNE